MPEASRVQPHGRYRFRGSVWFEASQKNVRVAAPTRAAD